MGRINQYPKASTINGSDTLLGVVGGTTSQVTKDVLLSGVTQNITNTTITGKKVGNITTVDDSSANGIPELTAYGKSVQDTYSGKNLLEIQAETPTTTTNGITFTINENKSISVSGASTERATRQLGSFELKAGSYILSQGHKSKGNSVCIFLAYKDENGTSKYIDLFTNTEGVIGFTLTTDTTVTASVDVRNANMTISNVTLYPMLRLASITDDTYEPYVGGEASPNPSFPQSITSVADDKSLVVKSVGKNLLENTKGNYIIGGVTWTKNNDGSITAVGTSTVENCDYYINGSFNGTENILPLESGSFISKGTGTSNVIQFIVKDKLAIKNNFKGEDCAFTVTEGGINGVGFRVPNGATVNHTFYPMIRLADTDDTYEPYVSTEASLTLADDLRGIPVTEGGNYTDESGQSWICDTIEKYADGTGKYIQRVNKIVLDGSEYYNHISSWSNESCFQTQTKTQDILSVDGYNTYANIISSHFRVKTSAQLTSINNIDGIGQTGLYLFLSVSSLGITTADELKSWLSTNNVTINYILAEPIETDLTEYEIAELEKLQTFEPYTTIYTDDMGDIAIKYFKNSDSGKIVGSLNDRISNLVALLQSNGVI